MNIANIVDIATAANRKGSANGSSSNLLSIQTTMFPPANTMIATHARERTNRGITPTATMYQIMLAKTSDAGNFMFPILGRSPRSASGIAGCLATEVSLPKSGTRVSYRPNTALIRKIANAFQFIPRIIRRAIIKALRHVNRGARRITASTIKTIQRVGS